MHYLSGFMKQLGYEEDKLVSNAQRNSDVDVIKVDASG